MNGGRIDKDHWLITKPVAHRGLWGGSVLENSLTAYERAAQAGYPFEIDLYLSTDGVLYCFHDKTLDRMTGRNVELQRVSEFRRRFARAREADHRTPFRRRRENRAARQPLKVDDQIIAPPSEFPHEMREFRHQRGQPPEPFAVEQNPLGDRAGAVVENLRERRVHEVVEFSLRAVPPQQFKRRENVEDVPQAARLDRQNPFDR